MARTWTPVPSLNIALDFIHDYIATYKKIPSHMFLFHIHASVFLTPRDNRARACERFLIEAVVSFAGTQNWAVCQLQGTNPTWFK